MDKCFIKIALVVCGPDLGVGPLALLSGSFEEKIDKAAKLNCEGVELMIRDPRYLDWASIKSALDAAGLEVPQLVTGELFGADRLCLVTADDGLRSRTEERLRSVIELSSYLGAMVNLGRVRGRLGNLGSISAPWAKAVELLCSTASYADACGVKVTIEPVNRYETDFVLNTADGMRLIENLGYDCVGLMLDLFHMNIEDASIEEGLRLAGDKLWHLHVADSNRLYPGGGHLDFDSIFATLDDMGYEGYVSAEILPIPDPDIAAQKAVDFIRSYLDRHNR